MVVWLAIVSVYTNRYAYLCVRVNKRVIATEQMTNWSTCCLTQTSLRCLQKTVGICQANKENITFSRSTQNWNAIYRKGSFQNMAELAVKGREQRG